MTFIDFLTVSCIFFFIVYIVVLNIGNDTKETQNREQLPEKKPLFKNTGRGISKKDFENQYLS